MIFPSMAHSLYFLMWLISCISWCGVYIALHTCIAFPIIAYILYILMWRTDVASSKLYLLMWRIYYCLEIHSISLYDMHPLFPDMAYFLYFLMWRILHWVSLYEWCIVFQTYIIYPGMGYIRFFWCGLFHVFPDVAHIALCLLIWSIYCSSHINDNSCYVAQLFFLM